ncbi:MAG: ATP-binding cassette domain-containing protein [Anaerolineae bacterium]|nr:ATP-binding cassette domain-containing protein [Anaerolineae bacterium]
MLRAKSLTKYYKSTPALEQLELEVPEGTVFGILGPNGAGKTTFLRLVMGFVFPTSGTVNRGGLSPAGIGYLPERAFYPLQFSIRNYLNTQAKLVGLADSLRQDEVARLLQQVGLFRVADQRIGTCSRGMLQRLGLAQALLGDPDLLVLDEPALGLDPAGQVFMREQISALHQVGKTVLLSSHHLDEVTRICTHVAVLSRGRLVRTGALASMLAPRATVVIETGPLPAELASRLSERISGATITERKIVLEGDAVLRKAEVLRLLLDEGVDIRHLSEAHATLEEVFLEAIER